MKKEFIIFFICFLNIFGVFSQKMREVRVLTDGDHGVALDWVLPLEGRYGDVYVRSIIHDDEGCVYVGGVYKGDMEVGDKIKFPVKVSHYGCNGYLFKCDQNGEILWAHDFGGSNISMIDHIWLDNDGNIVVYGYVEFNTTGSYLDDELYFDYNDDQQWTNFLMKFDSMTGAKMSFVDIRYMGALERAICYDTKGNLHILGSINENFKGANLTSLRSDIRAKGERDLYYLELDGDFNFVRERSLGAKGTEIDLYLNRIGIVNDTMYTVFSFVGDSIDVNLGGEKQQYVKGFSGLTEDERTSVLSKFLITSQGLRLLDYKTNKYEFDGVNGFPDGFHTNRNQKMSADMDRGTSHVKDEMAYLEIKSDLTVVPCYEAPYLPGSSWTNIFKTTHVLDDEDNIISSPYMYYNKHSKSDSLYLNISPGVGNVVVYGDSSETALMLKYGADSLFHWGLMMTDFSFEENDSDPARGVAYVGASSGYYELEHIAFDWDPDPDAVVNYSLPPVAAVVARYKETFRVKAEECEHTVVSVPDTFVHYGERAEVKVVVDDGFFVESVTANGILLEETEGDRYVIKEVKTPQLIEVVVHSLSSVKEDESLRTNIYPNPTNGIINVPAFATGDYKVLNLQGRVVSRGEMKGEVLDLSSLPSGVYWLNLQKDGMSSFVKVIKR